MNKFTVYLIENNTINRYKQGFGHDDIPSLNKVELSLSDNEMVLLTTKNTAIVNGKLVLDTHPDIQPLPVFTPPVVVLDTFSWTDPDTSNTFNLSYTDEDMLTATKLKAWFELGGGARNWTFSNGVTINVTQAQFLEVIAAGIAKVSENL